MPLIEKLQDQLPASLRYVIMTDRAHMPETSFDALCYEELLDGQLEALSLARPRREHRGGALLHVGHDRASRRARSTRHRSTVLHALMIGISLQDSLRTGHKILPVVPLFHVNAWGLPYAAPMTGAALVFPGPHLDGPSLFRLMDDEGVYSAWGVPTVWLGLLGEVKKRAACPAGSRTWWSAARPRRAR